MNPRSVPSDSSVTPRGTGIEGYYRLHARFYDATRWSFLFGREAILDLATAVRPAPTRILEVGCGTGRNLVSLARRFPQAELTGVDLSAEMLAVARKKTAAFAPRVRLLQRAYDTPLAIAPGFDWVLCSYALSMFNPGYLEAIRAARADIAPGGCLALVDFHATRFRGFARWMAINHVRMDAHLRPTLLEYFTASKDRPRSAYGGVWQYLEFVGQPRRTE